MTADKAPLPYRYPLPNDGRRRLTRVIGDGDTVTVTDAAQHSTVTFHVRWTRIGERKAVVLQPDGNPMAFIVMDGAVEAFPGLRVSLAPPRANGAKKPKTLLFECADSLTVQHQRPQRRSD